MSETERPICDYQGSGYRTEFWEGQGREYEDRVERVALRRLLPPRGRRLLDIGGGYGRLAPEYAGYEEVVLFDYALSQLEQGRALWGDSGPGGRPRYRYVAGDFYRLPFSPGLFDTVTKVRTIHHAADVPAVLSQVSSVLSAAGAFVLEFASKRNLKAIGRRCLGRQSWSPFALEPVEFVKLNFDFHPRWMRAQLQTAGLRIERTLAVSYFRLGWLKRQVPTRLLVWLDSLLQPTGALCPLSPSVFTRCRAPREGSPAPAEGTFFRCIACSSTMLVQQENILHCENCGAAYALRNGIYDMRRPLSPDPANDGR